MESIKFYQGEEDVVVIEKKDYGLSIFKEQYTQALLQLEKLVASPKENIPSILAFCGDRGEGKSSCMETVRDMLANINSQELTSFMESAEIRYEGNESVKLSDSCPNLKDASFYLLNTIDPAFFDEHHNVPQIRKYPLTMTQSLKTFGNAVKDGSRQRKSA